MADNKKRINMGTWYGDRKYQNEFYDAMKNAQEKYENRPDRKDNFGLMVCIPTGGGKTRLMVTYAINEFLYAENPRKIIWLAHSSELLEQARETFIEMLKDEEFGKDSDDPAWKDAFKDARCYGEFDDYIDNSTKIIFAGFQKLNTQKSRIDNIKNWLKPNSVIIVDEAHHSPARTYRNVIEAFRLDAPYTRLLFGLSATPLRTSMEQNDDLNKLFPTRLIDKDGNYVSVSMEELIAKGYLVPRISEEVTCNLDEEELRKVSSPAELEELLGRSDDFNQQVADHYLKKRADYGKTVIFTANKNQAEKLKYILNKKIEEQGKKDEISVYLVTGDDKSQLSAFKPQKDPNTNKINWDHKAQKVLVNIKVLGEGVDIRDIHTVFLAKPSRSPIDVTQMVGRALRSVPGGAKREAYIVNFAVKALENKLVSVDPRLTMELYELECGLRSDVLDNRADGKHKNYVSNMLQEEAAANIKLPFISFAMVGYYEIWPDGDLNKPSVIQIVTKEEHKAVEKFLKGEKPFPKRKFHFHSGKRHKDVKKYFEDASQTDTCIFKLFGNDLEPLDDFKSEMRKAFEKYKTFAELREWSNRVYESITKNEERYKGIKLFFADRKFENADEFWKSIRSELLGMILD